MTPNTASWDEIADFLAIDGWRKIEANERGGKRSRHIFYEKTLDDGRALQTHISKSGQKRPSPGRFGSILREQIEVSRQEFWDALKSGQPVDRPVGLDPDESVEHEGWVIEILVGQLHMSAGDIEQLSPDEAKERVYEFWQQPKT